MLLNLEELKQGEEEASLDFARDRCNPQSGCGKTMTIAQGNKRKEGVHKGWGEFVMRLDLAVP